MKGNFKMTPMGIAQQNYSVKQSQKRAYEKTLKAKIIKYVIEFGEKVENDTLTVRDCILPFLVGAMIGAVAWRIL